jgi:transglutaminase-like putative cysteine protease
MQLEDLSNYVFLCMKRFSINLLTGLCSNLIEKLDAITDPDEKLQFAIEYVQNHIYYVFNADEMNGHKPQEPSVTYENKQGDCKAKSVLLK